MMNSVPLLSTYKKFSDCASSRIKGFIDGQKEDVPYDIDILADGYLKARDKNDQELMEAYLSALMIRYWHMVSILYNNSKTLNIELSDMVDWMYEAFQKAFHYSSWVDETKAISKEGRRAAEKAFNQCLTSIRQYYIKNLNQNKRRIHTGNYIVSYDNGMSFGDNDDDNVTFKDAFASDNDTKPTIESELINLLVKKGKYFDAFVVDGIINQNSFVDKPKEICYTDVDEDGNEVVVKDTIKVPEFSRKKLASHLSTLDDKFVNYFSSKYKISKRKVAGAVNTLKKYNASEINTKILFAIKRLQNSKEVADTLCM